MDIADLYKETRSVQWELANGKASIKVELRSPTSDEVKAADHSQRRALSEAARKNKPLTPAQEDRFTVDRMAAFIASWEWPEGATFDGKTPDNSDDFKRFVLGHSNPVSDQIARKLVEELGDVEGFLSK